MDLVYNIVICDDDHIFTEEIKGVLERCSDGVRCRIRCASCGREALLMCARERPDAVFLDIDMPEMSGFETADRIIHRDKSVIIVFVSSKENMVYRSYEYHPFWFVPKSQIWILEKAAEEVIKRLEEKRAARRFTELEINGRRIDVSSESIEYAFADGHYVKIVLHSGERTESFRCKLSDVEKQLEGCGFERTHKRFLVNIKSIRSLSQNEAQLSCGDSVPVSRGYMPIVRQKFLDYLRSI